MKKLLEIVVLLLLTISCVQNASDFTKKDSITRERILLSRDVRTNILPEDTKNIYLGTYSDVEERYHTYSHSVNPSNKWFNPIKNVAKEQCIKIFKLEKPTEISVYLPSRNEIKNNKLYFKKYTKYLCEKSYDQIIAEKKEIERKKKAELIKKQKEKELKQKNKLKSNNQRTKTFICKLKNSNERSKIYIEGPIAYETTAIGIDIRYENVELTDKGAFVLTESSKDIRSWFIGAQSVLMVGGSSYEYNCR